MSARKEIEGYAVRGMCNAIAARFARSQQEKAAPGTHARAFWKFQRDKAEELTRINANALIHSLTHKKGK